MLTSLNVVTSDDCDDWLSAATSWFGYSYVKFSVAVFMVGNPSIVTGRLALV